MRALAARVSAQYSVYAATGMDWLDRHWAGEPAFVMFIGARHSILCLDFQGSPVLFWASSQMPGKTTRGFERIDLYFSQPQPRRAPPAELLSRATELGFTPAVTYNGVRFTRINQSRAVLEPQAFENMLQCAARLAAAT
jgi:hypothetical protein